jgi:type II secretory pathway component GspD/PulD (secretin)
VDVDSRYSQEIGVQWFGGYSSTDWGVPDYPSGPGGEVATAQTGINNVFDPAGAVQFGLVRSWGEVQAILSVLERDNKANIISNPRITTVNNRQAKILVGKKIPLITLDEAGNTVTQLTTIGISLLVTPHINDNNRITLDLHPEVSDLSSQATVQGGIIINTSEADTRVMLDNGQTAVIGGLIRMNDVVTESGVPILMDIPLIGSLFFKGSTKIQEKRELIIFITPRIVNTFSASMKN